MNILLRKKNVLAKFVREIEKEINDYYCLDEKFNTSDIEFFVEAYIELHNLQVSKIDEGRRQSLILNIMEAISLKKDFEDNNFYPQDLYAKALFYYWVRYKGLKGKHIVEPTRWKKIITYYRNGW